MKKKTIVGGVALLFLAAVSVIIYIGEILYGLMEEAEEVHRPLF